MNIKIKNKNKVGPRPLSGIAAFREAIGSIPIIYDEIKVVFRGQDKVIKEFSKALENTARIPAKVLDIQLSPIKEFQKQIQDQNLIIQNIFGETPNYPKLPALEKISINDASSINTTEKHLATYLDLLQIAIDTRIPEYNSQAEEIKELKTEFIKQTNLIEKLILLQSERQRVTNVEFEPKIPALVVNDVDLVKISSKTHMYYLLLILMPPNKKVQIVEWYIDDIHEALKPFQHDADWDCPSWKSIQEAMYSINEKFSDVTKSIVVERRLILNPRPQILQLNPIYFQC